MNPENSGSSSSAPITPQPQDNSQITLEERKDNALKGTTDLIGKYISRVEGLEKRLDKIEETKNQNIETLGLFVALFTFISAEFSLFKNVPDYSVAISLTLIIAGLLILFVLLLYNVVRAASSDKWWYVYALLFVVALGLIILGIFFPGLDIDKKPMRMLIPVPSPSATSIPVPSSRPPKPLAT